MKLPSLSKRAAYSLLYVTDGNCYRLDTDKHGAVIGYLDSVKVACPTSAKLADCLKQVITKDKPLGKKTWILYDRLTIHLLSVPTMQIEGVDEIMLVDALKFELEGLTGQTSIDNQLAYSLLGSSNEMSQFWISQIGSLAFEDIQKALTKSRQSVSRFITSCGFECVFRKSASNRLVTT